MGKSAGSGGPGGGGEIQADQQKMDFIIFVINFVFSIFYVLLAMRAVLPWIPHNRMNPWISPAYKLTDPVLNPIRLGLPPLRMGLDFSPFIAIVLFWLLQKIIIYILGG